MEYDSLKPQFEFELLKLVLLRESYIQRLRKKLKFNDKDVYADIDLSIVGLLDVLRETTIQVIETMKLWERTQLSFPNIKPFQWNKVNYIEKLCHDLEFLEDYPYITNWLGHTYIYII